MKRILIALDYNPTAQKVVETGYNLAKAMHAQTILLHVTSDATYYSPLNYSPIMGFEFFSNAVDPITSEEITRAAHDYLDKWKQHLGDENIQTEVKYGAIGETIIDTATELNVDIIVMGTHSRRGLEKILLGSVAENVLRRSSTPLLIIPTKIIEGAK